MATTDIENQDETSESKIHEPEQPEFAPQQESLEPEPPGLDDSEQPEYPIQRPESQPAHLFLHRTIVNIDNGDKLGSVTDLLFNPFELEVAAMTTSTGGILQRGSLAILNEQVRVWGKDFILVQGQGESLQDISPGSENWISLTNNIKGKQVISSNGVRLGQIEDVNIDPDGKIVDFRLSQIFVKGPLYESMRIPVAVTHVLGKDALIIDIEEIHESNAGSEMEG
jgi:sporulation protein YlmC with PRC-barrel domain